MIATLYAALAIPPFAVGRLPNPRRMRLTFLPLERKILFAYTNMTAEADVAKRWSGVGGEQAFLVSVTKATMPVYVLR